jgi:diguanylate cyclase (GGDEF)-like protein/PAS domain S-box-containing protein
MTADLTPDAAELRRRANERLQSQPPAQTPQSAHETLRLVHELRVHQIELEMQNEELRCAQAQAEAAVARYTDLYDFAPVGYFTLDSTGVITETNLAGANLLGTERARLTGKHVGAFLTEANLPLFNDYLRQVFAAEARQTCELALHANDQPRTVRIEAIRSTNGQECRMMMTDISALKQSEQELRAANLEMTRSQVQLERTAQYDALTSLPNRTLLADRLHQAMVHCHRSGQELSVAYLDLDGFKPINDIHGHALGDELLIAISQRMKQVLREGDTLARIGGDEFVALLVDLEHGAEYESVLARLLQAAAAPVRVGDTVLQVSASIGVTLYPQDASDADVLLRHADQAMYLAKQAGKNRYHLFDVERDVVVNTQREGLAHIRQALDRREFVLYYQPKVNMRTGEVTGAEALIRWQHPEHGLLLPAAFLPIIDQQPISIQLGEWVIDTALADMAAWQSAGLTMAVSVNIGALQLQQTDFPARLASLLGAYPDVEPAKLELEILETSVLEDIIHTFSVMHACRALGVHFALDDFGTGYSSLIYLRRLPADRLKIDQSFVLNMIDDPDDLAIVQGVIGLARAFQRQVIAEGVETVGHGARLLRLGCVLAQGYGIARPMPAADLAAWVTSWRPGASWMASSA